MVILAWVAPLAVAQAKSRFDLPPQALADSLRAVGSQAKLNILFDPPLVASRQAPALKGEFTAKQAFAVLLAGTDISHEFLNERTVVLAAAPPVVSKTPLRGAERAGPAKREDEASSDGPPPARLQGEFPDGDGNTFWARFRLAQGNTSSRSGTSAQNGESKNSESSSGEREIETILVTAQKREERLQDVPVPVTALSAATLVENSQLRIQDYYARVPGLNLTNANRGEPIISIRGLMSFLQSPTVGITVDDVPYGPTLSRGGGFTPPDFDPSDLQRIEVLRGPQGTLYGVSTLGGLIKYVTVTPSTDHLSGSFGVGVANIHGGDDVGYSVRGAINVPIGDTFAVRASAYTRSDPGYIDNTAFNVSDANRGDAAGGRLAALWRPSQTLSLKVDALYQERNTDGAPLITKLPGVGDLQQTYPMRNSGWFERKYEAYSATLSADLGTVNLTSITAHNTNTFDDAVDLSLNAFFSGRANTFFGVSGYETVEQYTNDKFAQEVRLAAPLGERFELLVGGFFTDEDSRFQLEDMAVTPATGVAAGLVARTVNRSTYEEMAAFADLTVHLTDRFEVQIGGRQSHNEQSFDSAPAPGLPVVAGPIPNLAIEDDVFTYLLTPRFEVTPDLMLYARFASGYRPGGINASNATFPTTPRGFDPDTTDSHEIGVKGSLFDQVLSFDASLYHIDWKDLQITVLESIGGQLASYQTNGSRARTQGLELSLELRPASGLTVAGSMSLGDAELTENFGPTATLLGVSGDRLPFSSRRVGNLSVDKEFPLANGWTAALGSSVTYVGDRVGQFRPTAVREEYPAYTQIDVRAGVEIESWKVNLFATNLTDKRGVLGGGLGALVSSSFTYTQPRTIGLVFNTSF